MDPEKITTDPAPSQPVAPSPPPAAPAAAWDTPAPNRAGVSDDIQALFRVDPFELMAEKKPPAEQSAEPTPAPAPTPTAPAPTAAPAATPAAPAKSEVDELRMQVARLQGELVGTRQSQPAAPAAQPTAPEVEVPPYNFSVPDEALRAMVSENPEERRVALVGMAVGVARHTHEQVVKHMRKELAGVLPHLVTGMVQNMLRAKEVFDDFYGTYPQLNRPELHPVVKAIGQEVVGNSGQWNQQIRDAIAQRVLERLRIPMQTTQQTAPAAPAVFSPGARPNGAVARTDDATREILSLL